MRTKKNAAAAVVGGRRRDGRRGRRGGNHLGVVETGPAALRPGESAGTDARAAESGASTQDQPRGNPVGPRGFRGRGGGSWGVLPTPPVFRGTSVQVCGLWPFSGGSSRPVVGVPVGQDIQTGSTVCCDPFSWFRQGLISSPSMSVFGLNGYGKALDVTTPIPTPDGMTTMGELQPGDYVLGADGRPTAVVATSEVMHDRPCYELRFSSGERIVADAQHRWRTETFLDRTRHARALRRGQPKTYGKPEEIAGVELMRPVWASRNELSVATMVRDLGWSHTRGQTLHRVATRVGMDSDHVDPVGFPTAVAEHLRTGFRAERIHSAAVGGVYTTEQIVDTLRYNGVANHAVRVAPALQLPEADLPLPPYAFGAWLGDGTSSNAGFTCADPQILDQLAAVGVRCTPQATKDGYHFGLRVEGVGIRHERAWVPALRSMGTLNNKHIPSTYLRASESQRRELLSGLLDTDGWVSAAGGPVFTTTSQQLADDVTELVASLGYRPNVVYGRARLNGRDCGPKWDVQFYTFDRVFGLDRKHETHQARQATTSESRRAYRYIVDAAPVPSRPVKCIQVAAEDGLFLVGSTMITTHNSSFTARMVLGLADQGVTPLFAGDLKGEYTNITRALGGQVLRFGERQRLNVLDLGALAQAASRIGGERGEELRGMAIERSVMMLATLVQIVRRSDVQDFEHSLLTGAVRLLAERHRDLVPPTLAELAVLLRDPPEELRRLVLAEDLDQYRAETRKLTMSIHAVLDGMLGRMFAGQSTEKIDLDAPAVNIDISAMENRSQDELAAVMLAAWSESFATIEAANALTDAGVAPQRYFVTVMDEMWRPMRLERAGLVDKLDSITRLNRNNGVGNIFVTHSLKDMESMSSAADVQKARGFAERSGIVVTAALAKDDLRALSQVKKMSEAEINTVAGWSTPSGWEQRMIRDPRTGVERPAPPPDAGKVLIKLGERAGIQTQVKLTRTELELHDTNERWVTRPTRDTAEGGGSLDPVDPAAADGGFEQIDPLDNLDTGQDAGDHDGEDPDEGPAGGVAVGE